MFFVGGGEFLRQSKSSSINFYDFGFVRIWELLDEYFCIFLFFCILFGTSAISVWLLCGGGGCRLRRVLQAERASAHWCARAGKVCLFWGSIQLHVGVYYPGFFFCVICFVLALATGLLGIIFWFVLGLRKKNGSLHFPETKVFGGVETYSFALGETSTSCLGLQKKGFLHFSWLSLCFFFFVVLLVLEICFETDSHGLWLASDLWTAWLHWPQVQFLFDCLMGLKDRRLQQFGGDRRWPSEDLLPVVLLCFVKELLLVSYRGVLRRIFSRLGWSELN